MTRRNISEIELQIMWNRLLSVVEEQAQTLVRTAFSTSAREAGDISAGVFDLAGPDAGAGGHRHARPHQHDGALGRAFPRRVPGRADEGRRRLRHQRSVEGHRPSLRSRRRVADLHGWPHRRAVRLHDASGGHGRRRPDAGRAADLPRGPVHPAAAPGARRRDERGPAGDDPRQRARAGAGDRRRLCADRVQRDRQPPPGRDDARVRAARPGHAGRGDHQPQPPGHGGGDRQAAAGHLDVRRCASTATRRRSTWSAR